MTPMHATLPDVMDSGQKKNEISAELPRRSCRCGEICRVCLCAARGERVHHPGHEK